MKRHCLAIAAILPFALTAERVATAATVGLVSPPVHHPVLAPTGVRTGSHWKINLGAWGEQLAGQHLRLRGYDVHSVGNRGIDRIGVKRAADGSLKDVILMEVKVSSAAKPQLAKTKYGGRQMSRKWLADNLKKMRRSNDPAIKKLALEISRFRKATGRPIASFGEVMHINPQSDKLTLYMADGKTEKASDSVEHLLNRIQAKAPSKSDRRWAARHLAAWDQIKAARRADAIDQKLAMSPSRQAAKRVLARVAGPIALIVAVAFDIKEIADVELAYRHGLISLRHRNTARASTIASVSGAFAGAYVGGAAGAWLGAFGGPFAAFTIPAGGIVGAAIGSVGGYFAGSAVAGFAATRWYDSIDSRMRERFELEWVSLPVPKVSSKEWRQ